MTEIFFKLADGSTHAVTASSDSVMRAAVMNDVVGIEAECGGCLSCATCHVYVAEDDFALIPPATEFEEELLEGVAAERRPNSRLSCQIMLEECPDSLTIIVPDQQL